MRFSSIQAINRLPAKLVEGCLDKFAFWYSVIFTCVRKTNHKRWQKVARSGPPPWDSRNRKIARYIPERASVLDVGSGAQTLREYIAESCHYQGCDLVGVHANVIKFDFNSGERLKLPRNYDIVVCSGVLEYIVDTENFLKNLDELGDSILLTYNFASSKNGRLKRLANNWINHYTEPELEQIFNDVGVEYMILHRFENDEVVYRICSGGLSIE